MIEANQCRMRRSSLPPRRSGVVLRPGNYDYMREKRFHEIDKLLYSAMDKKESQVRLSRNT